jgi:hypothetical protein
MAYVGTPIDTRNTFQSLAGKRFNGDGSTTAFTLDVAPSSTLDIEVFVGNVRQDPNSAYTLSGTTLTFTGAPPSGTNNIYVVHQAKSVGTIGVPAGGVSADSLASNTISGQTALTTRPATTDEFLISDAGTIKRIDYSLIGNAPAFQVSLGSNDTIGNDTYTKLDFGTEVVDTDSAFASGKFTVPANQDGLYMFAYNIITDSDSNSNLTSGAAALYKNGSSVSGSGAETIFSNNPVRYTYLTATFIMSLVATDYIEVFANIISEDSSGGRVLSGSSFNGFKLAGA